MKMPIALVCLSAITIAGPSLAASAPVAEVRPVARAGVSARPDFSRPDLARHDPTSSVSGAATRTAAAGEPAPLGDAGAPGTIRDTEAPRTLRRLPAVAGGWRLAGETDRREWVVRLSDAEARRPARLQIALRSAVSVMPEGSRIAVVVNGTSLGEIALGGRMETPARLEIPAGLLAAGANVVVVEARQRHRVDCSIDATYELWTEIDPALTGLSFESVATPAAAGTRLDLADLGTLWPNERGETRITAILPPGAGQDLAEAALGTVARVALIAGAGHPVAAMAVAPGDGPGIDVHVGTPLQLAPVAGAAAPELGTAVLYSGATDGRLRLLVAGRTRADFERAFATLDRLAETSIDRGQPAAVPAAARSGGLRVEPEHRYRLKDFGLRSTVFDGRLYRVAFDMQLPADFYPADTDKVRIGLEGGYAAGLSPEAQIAVLVNGRTVSVLPMPDPRGQIFADRPLLLPLGMFRPGLNHIEITAAVPAPADKTCDTVADRGRDRFLSLAETSITIPPLPRISQVPELAGLSDTSATGFGATIHVPHPDLDTLSAAATLVARLTVAAGRPANWPLRFGTPEEEAGASILIGAAPDIGPGVAAPYGALVREALARWASRPPAPTPAPSVSGGTMRPTPLDRRIAALAVGGRMATDPTTTGSIFSFAIGASGSDDPERSSESLRERWRTTATRSGLIDGWIASTARLLGGIGASDGRRAADIRPPATATLIVAQTAAPDRSAGWTLVTAPTAAGLFDAMADATAPDAWMQWHGAALVVDGADASLTAVPAVHPTLIAAGPWSLGNARLVLAAWLSRNPLAYALAGLVAAIVAGLGIAGALGRSGQRA